MFLQPLPGTGHGLVFGPPLLPVHIALVLTYQQPEHGIGVEPLPLRLHVFDELVFLPHIRLLLKMVPGPLQNLDFQRVDRPVFHRPLAELRAPRLRCRHFEILPTQPWDHLRMEMDIGR